MRSVLITKQKVKISPMRLALITARKVINSLLCVQCLLQHKSDKISPMHSVLITARKVIRVKHIILFMPIAEHCGYGFLF